MDINDSLVKKIIFSERRGTGIHTHKENKKRMCYACLHGYHNCITKDCPCVCNDPDFPLNIKRNGKKSHTTR